MDKTPPTLTVFTPAYNRAHTIERTYMSLCRQTSHDFLWVLVDDGSKDGTRALVETWFGQEGVQSTENEIVGFAKDAEWLKIHYIYKENGGKHTAYNTAYERIDTELAVCIDSDDWMPDNGVELIVDKWRKDGDERYAGLIGLDIFEDGYVVGTPFPKGIKECKTYDLVRKYGVKGDKKYVYRTDVFKPYFPCRVYPGERFGEVHYLYSRIDQDYEMLCVNDVYCVVEYQEDGLSAYVYYQQKQSPLTWAHERDTMIQCLPYFSGRLKRAAQYDAFAILAKKPLMILTSSHTGLNLLGLPIGVAYYFYLLTRKVRKIDEFAVRKVHISELKNDE